jgi:cell wall assembly regulator SMI1
MRAQLLERIRSDPESSFKKGASDRQIAAAEKRLGVTFPPSYRHFLRQFNGGEFRFARMFRISTGGAGFFDLDAVMALLVKHFPAFRKGELLAFGDDYSGDHYCFDLTRPNRAGECPVVIWDRLMGGDTGPEPQARSFQEFLAKGLRMA